MLATAEKSAETIDPRLKDFAIPPCPAILTKLLRETRADDPDFRKISQLIGADVALAAAVVNVANSAYYALRNKATSVQHAVSVLGLQAVTQRVTGLLLEQAFPAAAGSGMEQYWKSSMATAMIAALVARETGLAGGELCHTYALFMNCGMPVMLQKFPVYKDIFDGSALAQGDPVMEIEEERYDTNHAKIGAYFAQTWQLPDTLYLAIRHHHALPVSVDLKMQLDEETRALVAIGLAAEQIYYAATKRTCFDWATGSAWALGELSQTPEEFEDMATRVKGALTKL